MLDACFFVNTSVLIMLYSFHVLKPNIGSDVAKTCTQTPVFLTWRNKVNLSRHYLICWRPLSSFNTKFSFLFALFQFLQLFWDLLLQLIKLTRTWRVWVLHLQLINLVSVESNCQMSGVCQSAVYLEYSDDVSCLKDELCVGKTTCLSLACVMEVD